MADNGNFDPQARYAALDERVTNLRTSFVGLEGEMRSGFTTVNSHLNALSNELRGSSKTQWPVLLTAVGVAFTILVAAGSQALSPIRENVSEVKGALATIVDKMVTQQEMKWRSDRGAEDRLDARASIASIRDTMVYRNEWMERNLSRDHDIENIRADAVRDVANLQRQLDQQEARYQAFSNSLGNGRDFILDLKTEQGRLRDQISALTAKIAAEQAARP